MNRFSNITKDYQPIVLAESLAKPPSEVIAELYAQVMEFSALSRSWYWRNIRGQRGSSYILRIFSFLGLFAGALLPVGAAIKESVTDKLELTQAGVIILVAAGLLRTMDTIFGYSSGWMRYTDTVTQMEAATRKFSIEWKRMLAEKGDAIHDTEVPQFFAVAQAFESEITALLKQETKSWIAEFTNGLALLTSEIATQRKAGQESVDAQNAEQKVLNAERKALEAILPGAIQISWTFADHPTAAAVHFDGGVGEEIAGTSWSKTGLKPGTYQIAIDFQSQPSRNQRLAVSVKSGEVTEKSISLPTLPTA
jgi:hypothetical protein